jgi:hypothetical protein
MVVVVAVVVVVVVANLMHRGSTVSQYGEERQPAQKKKY